MKCPRCSARGKTWKGANPQCAFASGVFDPENWRCATMDALREAAEDGARWSEDQYAATLPHGASFIVLGWYKHRGRTEFAGLLTESEIVTLKLENAEAYLAKRARELDRIAAASRAKDARLH